MLRELFDVDIAVNATDGISNRVIMDVSYGDLSDSLIRLDGNAKIRDELVPWQEVISAKSDQPWVGVINFLLGRNDDRWLESLSPQSGVEIFTTIMLLEKFPWVRLEDSVDNPRIDRYRVLLKRFEEIGRRVQDSNILAFAEAHANYLQAVVEHAYDGRVSLIESQLVNGGEFGECTFLYWARISTHFSELRAWPTARVAIIQGKGCEGNRDLGGTRDSSLYRQAKAWLLRAECEYCRVALKDFEAAGKVGIELSEHLAPGSSRLEDDEFFQFIEERIRSNGLSIEWLLSARFLYLIGNSAGSDFQITLWTIGQLRLVMRLRPLVSEMGRVERKWMEVWPGMIIWNYKNFCKTGGALMFIFERAVKFTGAKLLDQLEQDLLRHGETGFLSAVSRLAKGEFDGGATALGRQ